MAHPGGRPKVREHRGRNARIRRARARGRTLASIGAEHGLTPSAVWQIVTNYDAVRAARRKGANA